MIKQSTIEDIQAFFFDHGFFVSVMEQNDLICITCQFIGGQNSLHAMSKDVYIKANKARRVELLADVSANFGRLKREIEAQAYKKAKEINSEEKVLGYPVLTTVKDLQEVFSECYGFPRIEVRDYTEQGPTLTIDGKKYHVARDKAEYSFKSKYMYYNVFHHSSSIRDWLYQQYCISRYGFPFKCVVWFYDALYWLVDLADTRLY